MNILDMFSNPTSSLVDPLGFAGPQNLVDKSLNAGGMMGNLGNFISQNPEKFSIMADMVGKGFDPNNAFAGVGTAIGQSSLANKALEEEKTNQQNWRKLVGDIISGKTPTTAPGEPGVSGMTVKPSKDGGANELSFNVTEPTDGGSPGMSDNKPRSLSLGNLMRSPF